jgi:hypothetical protein
MITACHYKTCSKVTFIVGLLQFLTSAIVVGWLLSVYWGLLVAVKSFDLPYLGNKPTQQPGGGVIGGLSGEQIGDAVNILGGNIPRSDQEQYSGFNRNTNPNGMINLGGGAMYNPQANAAPGGPGGFGGKPGFR